MTEPTPIQKLEDAVTEYVAALGDEGYLSSWFLAFQTSTITSNPDLIPLAFSSDFTMGMSTSGETAIGLARVTCARIEQELIEGNDD